MAAPISTPEVKKPQSVTSFVKLINLNCKSNFTECDEDWATEVICCSCITCRTLADSGMLNRKTIDAKCTCKFCYLLKSEEYFIDRYRANNIANLVDLFGRIYFDMSGKPIPLDPIGGVNVATSDGKKDRKVSVVKLIRFGHKDAINESK